jgi:DNA polymerase-3 subunit epsilon
MEKSLNPPGRHVIVDVETTGLWPRRGHRVIEIGAVAVEGGAVVGEFASLIDAGVPIPPEVQAIHGITDEMLEGQPKPEEVLPRFYAFITDSILVAHNAAFDVGFINNELELLGREPLSQICAGVVDTLRLARELHPGRKNSLNALCERYDINNSGRTLHGALLDAELLAEVYLAMTRGQESLIMELDAPPPSAAMVAAGGGRPALAVLRADASELAEHERVLAEIAKESRGKCVWLAEPS